MDKTAKFVIPAQAGIQLRASASIKRTLIVIETLLFIPIAVQELARRDNKNTAPHKKPMAASQFLSCDDYISAQTRLKLDPRLRGDDDYCALINGRVG